MRPRRSRKPPTPPQSALDALLDAANVDLDAAGVSRSLAGPWIGAADTRMRTARGGGWSLQDTPQAFLEAVFQHRSWTWVWVGDELLLKLPGWTQPPSILVAMQPGLLGLALP